MDERAPNDLSGVPNPAPPPSSSPPPGPSTSFDLNHPTIISLLYLSSFIFGITLIVGVILAYVWRGETHAEWEASHYTYMIRTFWIGLIGSVISFILMLVLIGFLLWIALAVLIVVRCVLSLINAQKQMAMPNPETWLA